MNRIAFLKSVFLILVWASTFSAATLTAQTRQLVTNERLTLGTETNRSASVRFGDIDRDGDLDVVIANGRHWPQQNFSFVNQGGARFSVMQALGNTRATSYACEFADLDGDGDLDIATGNDMARGQILINDGSGNFSEQAEFGDVSSLRSLTVADIDGDGDIDILTCCRGRTNQIYLNDGKARFHLGATFGTKTDSTIDVAVADVNGDGYPDLVLANRDRQQSEWLLNDQTLNFPNRKSFGGNDRQARAVAVGDLDGDGDLDWATGNVGQPNTVFLGDGTGEVEKSIEFGQPDSKTYCLAIADMDNDGDLDIIAGNVGDQNSVFFNSGDATSFQELRFGSTDSATYGICVGDLNGDGFADVATSNSDALNYVFLNRANRKTSKAEADPNRPAAAKNPQTNPPVVQENSPQKSSGQNNRPQPESAQQLPAEQSTDWPSFRGTGSRGVATGFPLPTNWNADSSEGDLKGVLWQTDVPGLGHSSPVIYGDKLFLVTAVSSNGKGPLTVAAGGKPTAADDNGEQEWLVLCYEKSTGKELWRKTAHRGAPRATRHTKATHANTSVCVDGKHVLAFLGSEGLHCYDLDGKLLWSRDLGVINISKYGIGWGFASSPAIHDDRIAIVCDDPSAPYVSVLSLHDGSEIWRAERKGICERSWGTPLIHETEQSTQLVVNGWPWILSYDLKTGKELWRVQGGGDNPVPTPFEANGLFYITNAHGGPSPIFAIRPEARGVLEPGDSTQPKSNNDIVWSTPQGGSYMSTPVVYGDYLYVGSANGIIRCFQAKTGERIYEKRLGRGAGMIASLVAGDDKVYCASENGTVYVLASGPEFRILSSNPMGEPCLATPAISAGKLYLRTTDRLIAVESINGAAAAD